MRLPVERKKTIITPDNKRVIARFFYNGDDRARRLIKDILELQEDQVNIMLHQILREFSKRHRSITGIFKRNFQKVATIVMEVSNGQHLSESRKLLIGSYFTMEYALESAALFNPSVVEDFDQSGLHKGQKRIIISFRATGEGHISSLVFRRAVIDENNTITMLESGDQIGEAERIKNHIYHQKEFLRALREMDIDFYFSENIMKKLPEKFTYDQVRDVIDNIQQQNREYTFEQKKVINEILWLADSHTEIRFSLDTDLSERVIFPISKFEKNGIEDARFTRFIKDNGEIIYYATYTAYDGYSILPKLIETKDFLTFKMFPLSGKYAIDKNLALFPRKINGRYAMISRIDGVNNYIMFSDTLYRWSDAQILSEPIYPWEFVQMGNGGSPIETEKGWLLITHGVGPVRKYCLGACLLDLKDPTKVIGRLKEPLLLPDENERSGYVPNVVYTCGAIVHNNELIIPYAMSDYASSFASVNLDLLLEELLREKT
ncbi:MAG: glycoside hydrolase family 130 protein [Prolixibacteraceae bacterium]|nr:glycoside hydrolase family 130 protein [Prolixibacteraceae bacterium]